MNININELMKYVTNNGGIVFNKPYYLNLFGIRNVKNTDTFNDYLIAYWFDSNNNIQYKIYDKFTTDPGLYKALLSPSNKNGCAILVEGWYRKLWKVGYHKGDKNHKALVQNSTCKVYRDNNKDKIIDRNPKTIQSGIFGINLHRCRTDRDVQTVQNFSEGCQVFQNYNMFQSFMNYVDIATKHGQSYFSYFLEDITKLNDIIK